MSLGLYRHEQHRPGRLDIGGTTRQVLMTAPRTVLTCSTAPRKLLSAKSMCASLGEPSRYGNRRPVLTGEGCTRRAESRLPSSFGGHNWMPMSFSPKTGLVYIPTIERG